MQKDGGSRELQANSEALHAFPEIQEGRGNSSGTQALNLRLPFGEKEVLESNVELIKRQLGLEEVEIHSAADVDLAGPHASLLKQNPPSPGSPTAIFVNR
ncbi:unnamed protein product [Microthlaspi erraticum]|uniref:Uncharacterized protein n=1 Tax=Microthlaspi erraticum TaxID=1685480 RepID=A0A6D2L974_9BRAS|nr:unnamed protein product [Microthlaspi erraticum]